MTVLSNVEIFLDVFRNRLRLIFLEPRRFLSSRSFAAASPGLIFGRCLYLSNHFIMHCNLIHSFRRRFKRLYYARKPLPRFCYGNYIFISLSSH